MFARMGTKLMKAMLRLKKNDIASRWRLHFQLVLLHLPQAEGEGDDGHPYASLTQLVKPRVDLRMRSAKDPRGFGVLRLAQKQPSP